MLSCVNAPFSLTFGVVVVSGYSVVTGALTISVNDLISVKHSWEFPRKKPRTVLNMSIYNPDGEELIHSN